LGIGGGGGNFFPVLAFEGAVDIFFVPEFLTTLPGLGGLGGAGGAGGRDGADEGFWIMDFFVDEFDFGENDGFGGLGGAGGRDGADGRDGVDGRDGADGREGADGVELLDFEDVFDVLVVFEEVTFWVNDIKPSDIILWKSSYGFTTLFEPYSFEKKSINVLESKTSPIKNIFCRRVKFECSFINLSKDTLNNWNEGLSLFSSSLSSILTLLVLWSERLTTTSNSE